MRFGLDAYDSAAGAGSFDAKCGDREVGRVTYRTVPLRYFELCYDRPPLASAVAVLALILLLWSAAS